jgi:putative phosphoesterase
LRILIISDIHGNYNALIQLLKKVKQWDCLVVLGDLIGYYSQVNPVVEFCRNQADYVVLGNHDSFLIDGCPDTVSEHVEFGIKFAKQHLSPENFEFVAKLPKTLTSIIDGVSCHFSHCGPEVDGWSYVKPGDKKHLTWAETSYDLITYGHLHYFHKQMMFGKTIVNPGSIGQPRDRLGFSSAVVYDTHTRKSDEIRCEMDNSQLIDEMEKLNCPPWFFRHFP